MSRDITAAAKTAAEAEIVRVIGLAKFDFSSAAVLVTSAPYNVVYDIDSDGNDETFTGVGALGKVAPVAEQGELQSNALSFELSGVDSALLSTALNEQYQGRDAFLWLALFDTDQVIIDDPVLIFSGLMDTMDISAGAEGIIVLTAQSRLAKWEDPTGLRFNNAAQQATYANDKGLEFVEAMVEKEIVWPNS